MLVLNLSDQHHDSIKSMGIKDVAREDMEKADVPASSWYRVLFLISKQVKSGLQKLAIRSSSKQLLVVVVKVSV